MRTFLTFFSLQGMNFLLLVCNIRAVAHQQYAWAVITDGVICAVSWTLLQHRLACDSMIAKAGFITGGMVGSLLGMWLTKVWG